MTSNKFMVERDLVERAMRRRGLAIDGYDDPNAGGTETGADVLIMLSGRRVGVQVTILDTGDKPGQSIAAEMRQAKQAPNGVYPGWAQNQPLPAIAATIRKKAMTSAAGFDEVWLLVSAGMPSLGSIISTFLVSAGVSAEMLNAETAADLARSKYSRAFLHPIVRLEDAIYEWTRGGQWVKHVTARTDAQGPTLWQMQEMMRKHHPFP